MGGPNLEVFKFGMYIMFPVGIMYYFGTNLERRFSVPDFWPKESQTNRIPTEREDIIAEMERLKARRLAARAKRLAREARGESVEVTTNRDEVVKNGPTEILSQAKTVESQKSQMARDAEGESGKGGWMSWFK